MLRTSKKSRQVDRSQCLQGNTRNTCRSINNHQLRMKTKFKCWKRLHQACYSIILAIGLPIATVIEKKFKLKYHVIGDFNTFECEINNGLELGCGALTSQTTITYTSSIISY